jgi:hypothetical protein
MILFYIVAGCIFLGGLISLFGRDEDTTVNMFTIGFIFAICQLLLNCIQYHEVQNVMSSAEVVKANCAGVEQIRNAYYPSQSSGSELVQGSIENVKQSAILSDAVEKCINLKANYNDNVVGMRRKYGTKMALLFGARMFYPPKEDLVLIP